MKKVMMSFWAMIIVSASAFAVDGTVSEVNIRADGTIKVKVGALNQPLVGTADAIKAMYAAALTAKTSGSNVTVAVVLRGLPTTAASYSGLVVIIIFV